MANTLTLLKDFCIYDFVERDCEKALSLLADDISWFGTSDHEDVHSIEEARIYMEEEMKVLQTPYRIKIVNESYVPVGPSSGVALIRMIVEYGGAAVMTRVTAASRQEEDGEKICCMHFSVADPQQQLDEFFPIEANKAKIAREKSELVFNTMSGGLIGGYIEPGFPFYFINERMLNYLGYADEEEFVADIGGVIINGIHPDDRDRVYDETKAQLKAGSRYVVNYRMKKRDGSYIWVHDIGKMASDESGRDIIISVCYDVTTQVQQEKLLRASERALDVATERAGLWFWKYNPFLDRAYFSVKCMKDFDLPQILENYPQSWIDRGFILPEYVSTYCDASQQIKDGKKEVIFEAQVKFKGGEVHWAEFRFTSLEDEDGGPDIVACTGRLIDYEKELLSKYELEKQKPALGEENLLIHAIFDLNTGKTIEYESRSKLEPGVDQYTTLEKAVEFITEDVIGEESKVRFRELNSASFLKEQAKSGHVEFSMDYRRKMPDGRIIWVCNILHIVSEPNRQIPLLFEYCYDIHREKMAEEIIQSSLIHDYEILAGVYLDINKMTIYGNHTGISRGTLVDYDVARRYYAERFVLPEERESFLTDSKPQFILEQVRKNMSYVFSTKISREDGTISIIKMRFTAYDKDHNIYVMAATDTTNMLREEEAKNIALREALAVARQANSAKSDFLSAMSHDIRTPMNAIVGMCELALAEENDKNQVHESLKTIQSSSQLLLSLINNILDMSRIESGKMVMQNEQFSLLEQIHETAERYRGLAGQKKQKFQIHLNIKHDRCLGDIVRIHSAIDNILANAIKYTPEGGRITYRVSEVARVKPGIGRYRFEISDTGIGISEEKQKHLFEPFYRGESEEISKIEGTGLGLSITKAIVDLKGGTISVKSAEGAGTIFVVELPLHFADDDVPLPKQTEKKQETQVYDLSGVHVLLCEDHAVNQKVARRILEKIHAEVTIAEDGEDGCRIFGQSPAGEFDIILMDIQMPKMNGYDAAHMIRERDRPQAKLIPIIAMTANAFSEDVQKSANAGMNEHLAKPIVPVQLYETICRYTREIVRAPLREKVKILFVDDVELNIAVLTAAISDDYEVYIARSGEEALNTLEQNPKIAAVITDIMMPGIDGIALIKAIRANERYQKVAIIANTQYGDAKQEQDLLALGADDFLYKPTTPALVQSRLKCALRKYITVGE